MRDFFKAILRGKPPAEYESILPEIRRIYKYAVSDFGGGCSFQKALTIVAFIKEFNYKETIDIGVYRGRSLFPQALAHKKFTNGIVYGIDPYDKADAIQIDRPDIQNLLDNFVETTNFESIYNDVIRITNKKDLQNHCKIIRKRSEDAKAYFLEENIRPGLIHIDGNHDTSFVVKDVNDYFPLVKDGGIIVMDDVSWAPVQPALNLLKTKSHFVGNFINNSNDFAIFIRNGKNEEISMAERLFLKIISYKY